MPDDDDPSSTKWLTPRPPVTHRAYGPLVPFGATIAGATAATVAASSLGLTVAAPLALCLTALGLSVAAELKVAALGAWIARLNRKRAGRRVLDRAGEVVPIGNASEGLIRVRGYVRALRHL